MAVYLKGISTGAFDEALSTLFGGEVKGLSASTIGRLKSAWEDEYVVWQRKALDTQRFVYLWADGVYLNVRLEDAKQCVLVVIGVDEHGFKHFLAIEDGYRESTQSWREVLQGLKSRGLEVPPELAVGDGALGFWTALAQVYPSTRAQRCWVHKTANVLNRLPKGTQAKAKEALRSLAGGARKDAREVRAVDRIAVGEAVACVARFDLLLALYIDRVVSDQHQRDRAPRGGEAIAGGTMQREPVEDDAVTPAHVPVQCLVAIGIGFDLRGRLEPVLVGIAFVPAAIDALRTETLAPFVGASQEPQRRFFVVRIDRDPHHAHLAAFHAVERLVVVPRRASRRAGLLDPHRVVQAVDPARVH